MEDGLCGGRGRNGGPVRSLLKADGDCSGRGSEKWWDLVWGQDLLMDIGC